MKIHNNKIYAALIVVCILFISHFSTYAQQGTTEKNVQKEENGKGDTLNKKQDSVLSKVPKEPIVKDVFKEGNEDKSIADRKFAGIGDIIVIRVANADVLLLKSKCKKIDGKDSIPCNPQPIRLFINGRMITPLWFLRWFR